MVSRRYTGGTLADLTLLVDIHTTGGAHLLSHALRGPPTVRFTYKSTYDFTEPEPGETCLWTFIAPLPPGWHKVEKKVSCSLVNPSLGKARLIIDRQAENTSWYDMTQPIEENAQEKEPFKKSYGGQNAPELEASDEAEMCSYPLLNIEETGGNLTISLYAVGACELFCHGVVQQCAAAQIGYWGNGVGWRVEPLWKPGLHGG